MSYFEDHLLEQIKTRFSKTPQYLHLIGGFNLSVNSEKEIENMILESGMGKAKIKSLPFDDDMSDQEMNLYEIDDWHFISIYDSNFLEENPVVLNLYGYRID